jgi:hypothetical protein
MEKSLRIALALLPNFYDKSVLNTGPIRFIKIGSYWKDKKEAAIFPMLLEGKVK